MKHPDLPEPNNIEQIFEEKLKQIPETKLETENKKTEKPTKEVTRDFKFDNNQKDTSNPEQLKVNTQKGTNPEKQTKGTDESIDLNSNPEQLNKDRDTPLSTSDLLGTKFPIKTNILSGTSNHLQTKALNMCYQTFWHTLTSTTKNIKGPTGGIFIFTGDIGDMWVRDSAAQVHGYIPLARHDNGLKKLISDLINRTAYYINIDPYANSFSPSLQVRTDPYDKRLGRYGYVTTYNYELDSGCYFFRLIYTFWKSVGDTRIFKSKHVQSAVEKMVSLWEVEQNHHLDKELPGYRNPATNNTLYRYPELSHDGKGSPVNYTGMTWSGFRPSDDACKYGYLVPANMFASSTLSYVVELANSLWNNKDLATRAKTLKNQIDDGIKKHAIIKHEKYGNIYAYEVDGLGNSNLMDDANVPSLLSIPYLGFDYDPEVYENTRKFILSPDNPNFVESKDGSYKGIGSEHMKGRINQNIWPMSQIMQGLTSDNNEEKLDLLSQILSSDANTGFMHESYDANNPFTFTRSWFCWADALFAEFVQSTTTHDCPKTRPNVEHLSLE